MHFFVLTRYIFTWVTNYKLQNILIVFYLLWHCFEMRIQLKYHAHGQSQLVWTDHDLMLMFSVKSIIHSIFTALNIIFRRIYTNWNLIDSERERESARWRNQFCKIKVNCQQIEILAESDMDGMRNNLPKLWVELTQWYNQHNRNGSGSRKNEQVMEQQHITENGFHVMEINWCTYLIWNWRYHFYRVIVFFSSRILCNLHANNIFSTVSLW